jgi:soluble lytic murein transglycosylase-like protein
MEHLEAPPGMISLILILMSCVLLLSPLNSRAQFFKYVDPDGVIHYTNVPTHPDARKVLQQASPPVVKSLPAGYTRSGSPGPFLLSCNPAYQRSLDPHIRLICHRYGMDQHLVKAVIRAESGFNPQAISPKGAIGLMQLMPGTSRDLGVLDPLDPYQNIDGGVRYLKFLLDRFNNDYVLALAAYNAGPMNVEKHGGVPPFDETQVYVRRVMDLYSQYTR